MRKTPRQPTIGSPTRHAVTARATPTGSPDWRRADARPRMRVGEDSARRACPTAHSPPTPRPVTVRKRNRVSGPVANAVSAVPTEYTKIVHVMTRLRPKTSER
jgi:hypothetical protein